MNVTARLSRSPYAIEQPKEAAAGVHDEGFDVRGTLAMLWRGKWVIGIGGIIGLLLALTYVASLDPRYTASAKVLFDPVKRNVVNLEEILYTSANDGIVNQIEILRSTSLLDKVVEQLNLHRSPEFNPELGAPPGTWDEIRAWFSWRSWVPWNLLADLGILDPPPPAAAVLSEEDREARALRRARSILLSKMNLQPVEYSRVIQIAVTTGDPQMSARVANEIAKRYITAQLDARLAATQEATVWLSERVEELRQDVQNAETAVADYSSELADRLGQTASVMKQQLDSLNAALAGAAAERSAAGIRHRRALEELESGAEIATVAEFQESELMRVYRRQQAEVLAERADFARLVPPGHARLGALDGRLETIRASMRQEAERITETLANEYDVAQSKEQELADQVRALERQVQAQDEKEIELRQLQREADAARLIYESFLGRLKETTQQETLEEADAILLSPAEAPGGADSVRASLIAAGGGLAGAMLAFGLVLLLDRLNNTFRSVDQLIEETSLPVLGAIPSIPRNPDMRQILAYVLEKPTSSLAESIRSLRTSLFFYNVDQPPKVVMFASSVPEEGKSTTSVLLALIVAQMQKSAIIVDCDLRRPALSSLVAGSKMENTGLLDVLEGTASLEESILKDPESNLHVLTGFAKTAGRSVNAPDILSSKRFRDLIVELRSRYDLVILDAPPVISVTDARIISPLADAVLFCVRWDNTPRGAVKEALREFSMVDPNIAGLVMTRVDEQKASSYGYSNYGYGYYRGHYADHYYEA